VRYYDNSIVRLQLPDIEQKLEPLIKYDELLIYQPQLVTYAISKQYVYYGIVKDQKMINHSIIIGPVTNVISKDSVRQIMTDAYISSDYLSKTIELFHNFPTISFERFLHILCFINHSINHTVMTLEDIVDYKNEKILFPIKTEYTSKKYKAMENRHFHNTYQFEKQYLNLIENGDLASLNKLLDKPVAITPGIVAENSIRQIKNIFIASATLTTRSAIKGGLDMESAYQLSDVYIQQMERLQSIDTISKLQYQMLFDFTERVLAAKIPSGISLVVYECIKYINANINQPITVADVAANVQRSRSFISRKFKQELGFVINDFINSRKIQEAKYLLTYSDKSISEISFYLCYSSQSYFQNVFKKVSGMTPNTYRIKTLSNKDI